MQGAGCGVQGEGCGVKGDLVTMWKMPRLRIDLMLHAADQNDPFYASLVRQFYADACRRHRKLPWLPAFAWGIAVCRLPPSGDGYLAMIEAAGRRNIKKAKRLGYTFARIMYNDHLADIERIRRSTPDRQGEVDAALWVVKPCKDPPSRTNIHDYPYFGVSRDGRLMAYAGCLVAGEVCLIEHILGHADALGDGVVPMLIAGMAEYIQNQYPNVKYYGYGTYFGAAGSMRRFKRKFGFTPHRVEWGLGES